MSFESKLCKDEFILQDKLDIQTKKLQLSLCGSLLDVQALGLIAGDLNYGFSSHC